MVRYIALAVLSALIGSSLATMMWVAWEGSTGAPHPAGFVIGITLITMFFTVPVAMMLVGLQASLIDRGISVFWRDGLVLLFAALVGAATLWVLSFRSVQLAALGSAYGLTTAIVLLSLQRLLKRAAQRRT